MSDQLFLNLDNKIAFDHIIAGNFNKLAYKYLFLDTAWITNCLIIVSPLSLGKTLLLESYAKKNKSLIITQNNIDFANFSILLSKHNSIIIDNIENLIDKHQENLFMLYNLANSQGKKIIISSIFDMEKLNINLLDLKTRLQGSLMIHIEQPTAEEYKLIVLSNLANYQIKLKNNLIDYILEILNGDLKPLNKVIFKINTYIMINKKQPSLVSLKNIFNEVFINNL
jgi:chromosomal replication initiation ATPase DnaA